ncbi:hypothetical protein Bbelb_167190 [Branchiostoma belcheri]|nr:hypothetical protein Bbelb_167190 [Branchiostoma belcheri]
MSQLVGILCVLGTHLAVTVTAGEVPTCPPGQFAYLVPDASPLYVQAGEYVCRTCRLCADGQELVQPCVGTNDTRCGGCIREKEGFVWDEGTRSCQHRDVVAGLARPEDFLTPQGGEKLAGTAPVPVPAAGPDQGGLAIGLWVSMAVLAVVAAVLLFLLLRRRGDNNRRGKKLQVTTKAVEEQSLSGSDSQTSSPFLQRRDSEETVPAQVYNNRPWSPTGSPHSFSWNGPCFTQPKEGYV